SSRPDNTTTAPTPSNTMTASAIPQRLRVLVRIGVLPGQARRGENQVAHCLVISNVARATAYVFVQRVGYDLLHAIALDRLALQALDQYGGRIDETRRAIAALKAVMLEKSLLHRGHAGCAALAARLGMPLDR